MAVENDIRTVLLTLSEVTDLVGTSYSARIRPDRLHRDDDEDEEHIIIEIDNEEHLNDLTGTSQRLYSYVTLRCRAREKADARALAEAVRLNGTDPGTGLAGYSGTVNGHTFDAVLMDEQTAYTPKREGSDEGWYDVFCNYVCTVAETD